MATIENKQANTKTNKAMLLFDDGKIKESLKIFATFRSGFTVEEKRCIEIAAETLSGHNAFYESLGIDTNECLEKAKIAVKRYCKI
jgi:hypothetical protein